MIREILKGETSLLKDVDGKPILRPKMPHKAMKIFGIVESAV